MSSQEFLAALFTEALNSKGMEWNEVKDLHVLEWWEILTRWWSEFGSKEEGEYEI